MHRTIKQLVFLLQNPYTICGFFSIVYNITYGAKILSIIVEKGLGSTAIFAIVYRMFIACFFASVGLLDGTSSITFYDKILNEIDSSSRKKVYALEDLWCVALLLVIFPEHITVNWEFNLIFTFTYTLKVLIPLVSMVQFSLCCDAVQSSYRQLQDDLLRNSPRISSFTLRRIRVRQLDTADRVRDISSAFGLRQLMYIVMIQLILLEKIDSLVNGVASNMCEKDCLLTLISFCGYFLTLWYFSYQPFRAACEHHEALATLMDLDTREMDLSALQEMVLLAEDLYSRETQFSAAGCFYVGFNIFYSVIGIVFSYLMIIGPMAYNKNRNLWTQQ